MGLNAGGIFTCALTASGTVACWGDNTFGQLGTRSTTDSFTPVTVRRVQQRRDGPVSLDLTSIAAIAAGGAHACALRANGDVLCWGDNSAGQLGIDSVGDVRTTAVDVPSFSFNIDPNASLERHGRRARVAALINCPLGEKARIEVELTQDATLARGHATADCVGALARVPLTVEVRGHGRLEAGPAQAEAKALVREHGHPVDVQEWTRQVELALSASPLPHRRSTPDR